MSGWTKKAAGWPVGRAGPPKPPAMKSGETLGCRTVTSSGTGPECLGRCTHKSCGSAEGPGVQASPRRDLTGGRGRVAEGGGQDLGR